LESTDSSTHVCTSLPGSSSGPKAVSEEKEHSINVWVCVGHLVHTISLVYVFLLPNDPHNRLHSCFMACSAGVQGKI